MSNRILSVTLRDVSLVAAEAVVHVTVTPERVDAGTQIRGRLMGPRCRFASTVEIAYHLRPLPMQDDPRSITLRAVIPEANFWSPQAPHLYAGPAELWQDGRRVEVAQVRHGLRHVALGAKGLRLNGVLLPLRGREVAALGEDAALALREAGYNLVIAPVGERRVWEIADRIGLFVLGRAEGESALGEAKGHPSCLGWADGDGGGILGDPGGPFTLAEFPGTLD